MKTLYFFNIITLFFLFNGCEEFKGEEVIYLIPSDYRGPVMIIHNQEEGVKKEYERDKRVYRIPENGFLVTQFKQNYGYQFHTFYYESTSLERVEIPLIFPNNEGDYTDKMQKDNVYAFDFKIFKSSLPNNIEFEITTFYIGTLLDVDKSNKETQRFKTEKFKEYIPNR